jgi:hypothetical protein
MTHGFKSDSILGAKVATTSKPIMCRWLGSDWLFAVVPNTLNLTPPPARI